MRPCGRLSPNWQYLWIALRVVGIIVWFSLRVAIASITVFVLLFVCSAAIVGSSFQGPPPIVVSPRIFRDEC
jgi:hypothetical protein